MKLARESERRKGGEGGKGREGGREGDRDRRTLADRDRDRGRERDRHGDRDRECSHARVQSEQRLPDVRRGSASLIPSLQLAARPVRFSRPQRRLPVLLPRHSQAGCAHAIQLHVRVPTVLIRRPSLPLALDTPLLFESYSQRATRIFVEPL